MKQRTGRTRKTTGVSMSPDLEKKVRERTAELKPRVSSFSNYVVQLMTLDLERGILGPTKKGKQSPFEMPLTPFKSNALTVAC